MLARAAALACLFAAASVNADPAARDGSVVVVTVLGTVGDFERIRGSFGPNDFEGAATHWSVRARWDARELLRADPEDGPSVRCWIDVSQPRRARLYFADAARERFLLRDVPLPEGLSDLGREALAQVLEMSVSALFEDSRVGMSRSEAQRALDRRAGDAGVTLPASAPNEDRELPPPAASELGLELRAAYSARIYAGPARIAHGPALSVAWVTGEGPTGSSLWTSVGYELPRELSGEWVGLEWQTTTFRAGADLTRRLGEAAVRGYARLGGGVDLVRFEPKRAVDDPALSVTAERTSLEAVFSGAVGACSALGGSFDACAHVSGDLYPVLVHYDLRRAHESSRVFEPWRFRPGFALALVVR